MIRPLTKCEPDGVAYLRPAGVEQQIGEALGHDLTELRQRLRITDRKSPGYLKSECLVHLIRQSLRAGQQAKADVALTVLLYPSGLSRLPLLWQGVHNDVHMSVIMDGTDGDHHGG